MVDSNPTLLIILPLRAGRGKWVCVGGGGGGGVVLLGPNDDK